MGFFVYVFLLRLLRSEKVERPVVLKADGLFCLCVSVEVVKVRKGGFESTETAFF